MRTLFKHVLHNLEENLETLNKKQWGKVGKLKNDRVEF